MKLLQAKHAFILFLKLFCTLPPISAHNFIPYIEMSDSFPIIQSPVLKPNHKRKLRKPNSTPRVVPCSVENTAHSECVRFHNDCNSTQCLPISSISCSVVASSTVSSPGPSSLLAQILNTYVVLGSSRYTSICR